MCVLILALKLSEKLLILGRIQWDIYVSSSVGIATELRAGRSGIESRWGRDFPPVQTGPGANPAYCTMDTRSFPGVKCGRCVLLTTHFLLVPRSWKSRAIPLPTLWACNGITLPLFYIYIYMYKGLRAKYPLLLLDTNDTWIFSTDFWQLLKYQMS